MILLLIINAGIYFGSGSSGFAVLFMCCIICSCVGASKRKSRGTTVARCRTHPPPRTTIVTSSSNSAAASRPTQSAAAFVMTAVRTEAFVVKTEEKAPPSYPQAQTYTGEAPPDYNTACNYPKADYY